MATVAIEYPPSNQILPGSYLLKSAPFPETLPAKGSSSEKPLEESTPESIASKWTLSFNKLLRNEDVPVEQVFLRESCWRDLLCMTWDFRTIQGVDGVSKFIDRSSKTSQIKSIETYQTPVHKIPKFGKLEDLDLVQAYIKVDTSAGAGQGYVQLAQDATDHGKWKAFTLFTYLEELKDHPEDIKTRRPTGHERDPGLEQLNWSDRRNAQRNFEGGREPTILILGAGQGGLTLAARLKQLGLETLLVDRNARIGDNWRNRYHQLVLHDSVWFDHMPYLPFPPNWPKFTPKDKLADWFEYYAGIMELNVWTSTELKASEWNEASRQWTVTLTRAKDGVKEDRTFHPKHIVLATGHSGEPNIPSNIQGLDSFKGDRLTHSAYFDGPKKNGEGKKAVVVGSCNSAHDIARDYHDHGYATTMVQRSSTYIVTCQTLIEVAMAGLYSEDGIHPVEDADVINFSLPNPVAKRQQLGATAAMTQKDGKLLQDLSAAGFAIDSGPDRSGLWIKYLSRGGGYYIDVGCSQLIADKKIAVKQGQEVAAVEPHGLVFGDGSKLQADEIVFATGYQNMRESARKFFGDGLADRVGDVWGFDDEGETRTIWRRSGHPGFWFFGGNLALCRFYSRLLALQIKAVEAGLMKV